MCCIKISDRILLENILAGAVNVGGIGKVRFADIENFSVFLKNNLPGYVDCDMDTRSIHKLTKSCYRCVIEDGAIVFDSEKEITRRKTLSAYPVDLSNQILQLAEAFWRQYEPGRNVPRMKLITVA